MNNRTLLKEYIKQIILIEQNAVKYNLLINALENSNKSDLLDNINQTQIESQISKLKNYQFDWLLGYINSDVIEDLELSKIIETIIEFDKKKNTFSKEDKSKNKDIAAYSSIEQIKSVLGPSKRELKRLKRIKLQGEYEIVYEDENIKIYFPHSKESSCEIANRMGIGSTKWCTSAEKEGTPNLFYYYTLSNEINLYYILSNSESEEYEYMNKITVGASNGKIIFEKNSTVGARNNSLSDQQLSNYFGKEYWNNIKNIIINFDKKYENQHPGTKYVKEKADIAKSTKDRNIQLELANDRDKDIRRWVAINKFIDKDLQLKFTKDITEIRAFLSWNPNLDKEVFSILAKDYQISHILAQSPDLTKEMQLTLAEMGNSMVRKGLASNPSLDKEIQLILVEEKYDTDINENLAKNPNIDKEVALILANNEYGYVREILAENPNIDKEVQLILFENGNYEINLKLSDNPNLDPEIRRMIENE